MPTGHQGQAVSQRSWPWMKLPALVGSGAGLVGGRLRLGVGHASTVRPDPSTLAWWKNEAPNSRAACSSSQAWRSGSSARRRSARPAAQPDTAPAGSLAGHGSPRRAPRPGTPDRQSFDALADRYDRLHDLQADPIGTWLPGALPQHGRRALDAGCGSGRHTLVLADRFDEVIGVDLSAEMVRLATARRTRPNIAYRHADLMGFGDPAGFDLVLSINTLHHVPDLDGALDHLRRLTRPAGLVVLVDCVAGRSPLPRWWFVGGAVRHLLVDLIRRPGHAGERFALRTDRTWLDHLTRDRYLSRAGFERRYAQAFPGARFQRVGGLHTMLWHAPGPRRQSHSKPELNGCSAGRCGMRACSFCATRSSMAGILG
jgi:SAM-dependent methyltransferase